MSASIGELTSSEQMVSQKLDLNSEFLTPRLAFRPGTPAATHMFAAIELGWAANKESIAYKIIRLLHQLQIPRSGAYCFCQRKTNEEETHWWPSTWMKDWKYRKSAVGCLLKQVFSTLSHDRTREIFQKPQLGTSDPGVQILCGEKPKSFLKGEFSWVILWKQLGSVHFSQYGWILVFGFLWVCLISLPTAGISRDIIS